MTTTQDLGVVVLSEVTARCVLRYPRLQVELQLGGSQVDLERDGFDLALRISRGPLASSSLIAQKVGEIALKLYAAPAYLRRHGTPASHEDLHAHHWVAWRGAQPLTLDHPDGPIILRVQPRVLCDDMQVQRELLKAGIGIGIIPSFLAEPAVADGSLLPVLPKWRVQTGAVYLVRPSGRQIAPKLAVFRDLLLQTLKQRPLAG